MNHNERENKHFQSMWKGAVWLKGGELSVIINFACLKSRMLVHYWESPGGSRLEYLHCGPASRKRRRKGNPVPRGISEPPCSWGI
jgi:hypothetical protein